MKKIVVKGAREHNLKNIDVEIPRDKLVVITGPVGFGQILAGLRHHLRRGPAPLRRIAVGLRAPVSRTAGQARRRLHRGPVAGHRHRAEIGQPQSALERRHHHRDLRLPAPLWARAGEVFCWKCGQRIFSQTIPQMVDRVLGFPEGTRFSVLAPVVRDKKGDYAAELSRLRQEGYVRANHRRRARRAGRAAQARQDAKTYHRGLH
jgi:excinuclease ABC subunit A